MVLEVAMKIQHFQQRNLLLHDPWKWLLAEFAAYYGVSEAYTKLRYSTCKGRILFQIKKLMHWLVVLGYIWLLRTVTYRYLSYVMDVATPTADCLILIHDLLLPVITKGHTKSTLSHQEVCARFLVNNDLCLIENQVYELVYILAFINFESIIKLLCLLLCPYTDYKCLCFCCCRFDNYRLKYWRSFIERTIVW